MPQFQNLSDAFKIAIGALDKAKYQEALSQINELSEIERSLGMLRIATRIGKFTIAQEWAKNVMILTSNQRGPLKIAVHGAIGELFVRAGSYHNALMHMQIMNSFRPRGSSDRQRHYSYLAIPLARLGEISVAESYYMRAFVLAKQQADHYAASLSLARRAALTRYTDDEDYLLKSLDLMAQLSNIDERAALVVKLLCYARNKYDLSGLLPDVQPLPYTIENRIEGYLLEKQPKQSHESSAGNQFIDIAPVELPNPIKHHASPNHLFDGCLNDVLITPESKLDDVLDYLFV